MKPGEQKASTNGDGNAVVSAVGLWAASDGIHLRIDMTGAGTPTPVANGPDSEKDHRILFRDLREMLEANGCWEPGDEAQASSSAEDQQKRR